jgi:cytoskeletal protein RodZ
MVKPWKKKPPPASPQANITDLIAAIREEGRANRSEESTEDAGKARRERISIGISVLTLIVLGATLYALWRQIGEMQRVYDPIKAQASAASTEAQAASSAAEATKTAADAATAQSKSSDQSLTLTQRAWVGPVNAGFEAEPAADKPINYTVNYQNTGHQPAIDFVPVVDDFWLSPTEVDTPFEHQKIEDFAQRCQDTDAKPHTGSVAYPTVGFS